MYAVLQQQKPSAARMFEAGFYGSAIDIFYPFDFFQILHESELVRVVEDNQISTQARHSAPNREDVNCPPLPGAEVGRIHIGTRELASVLPDEPWSRQKSDD